MIEEVFCDDDMTEAMAVAIQFEKDAERLHEEAVMFRSVAEVMHVAGGALHSVFMAGDEPKLKHTSQREHLIDLSNALKSLHRKLFPEVAA